MNSDNKQKYRNLGRRILQYLAGIVCMAIGLVMLKRVNWGVSPITTVPDAIANITPLTLGNVTILIHLLCVAGQILVQRKITLKALLTACVGVPFGYLVDLFMLLWNPSLEIWQKIIVLILGIAIQGVGVALVSGCDMMLPAPDELNHVISQKYHFKLANVKMAGDAIYVAIAAIINLISTGSFNSIGISSVASVLLTGRFVGLTYRFFPRIKMEPFFKNAN